MFGIDILTTIVMLTQLGIALACGGVFIYQQVQEGRLLQREYKMVGKLVRDVEFEINQIKQYHADQREIIGELKTIKSILENRQNDDNTAD